MTSKHVHRSIDGYIPDVNQTDNLIAACEPCNHYKRQLPVDDIIIPATDTTSKIELVGFRDYMQRFHIRLGRLPKKTIIPATERRIEYMNRIAQRYGITPTTPFSGKFYFETLKTPEGKYRDGKYSRK